MTIRSIKDVVAAQAQLRSEADQLFVDLCVEILAPVPQELERFMKHERWVRNSPNDLNWCFPSILSALIDQEKNQEISTRVRWHMLSTYGFVTYRDLRKPLKKLARVWKGCIRIEIRYFSSKHERITRRTFEKHPEDVSAYMDICYFAVGFEKPRPTS